MPPTRHDEATKKARAKYQKEKTKQIGLRFCPTEMDVYDFIQSHDNVNGYIKRLVREDMERSQRQNRAECREIDSALGE